MIAIFMGASGLFNLLNLLNLPQWNYFKPKAIGRQAPPTSFGAHTGEPYQNRARIWAFYLNSSWPGSSRPSTPIAVSTKKDVDARHKAGHDEPGPTIACFQTCADRQRYPQLPLNTGFALFENASNARVKSAVVMHSACAIASASIASSTDIAHSIASIRLVMVLAKVGPSAISLASDRACDNTCSGATTRLKKPQRSPSSAVMKRPVKSSSEARDWPMMRGRIAQAPMSQPARPTLLNRNATLAPIAARRMSDAIATPAPAQMPSTAATIGCGQARIALTRSPVMRVKAVRPLVSICTSGPIISNTSPPDEKLPPAPDITTVFTSSSMVQARKKSVSSR